MKKTHRSPAGLATALVPIFLFALLVPPAATAELWRSPLLDRVQVRLDAPASTSRSAAAEAELRAALGDDAERYESFTVTYLPAGEVASLAELAERRGLSYAVAETPAAQLPSGRIAVEELERRGDAWAERGVVAAPVDGLYLLAFAYPAREAWLAELEACGVETLQSLGAETFAVYAAEAEHILHCGALRHLAWVDRLHNVDRLSSEIFTGDAESFSLLYGRGAELERIRRQLPAGVEMLDSRKSPRTGTLIVQVAAGRDALVELADTTSRLLFIAPFRAGGPSDERQGQILAGQHDGSTVTQTGYVAWLQGRGLATPTNQQNVAVFDSGYHDGFPITFHHPDLSFPLRVVNEGIFAGTSIVDRSGHGTVVTGIIAGDGAGTGAADQDGYLYGTGISPRSGIVAVKIFDYAPATCQQSPAQLDLSTIEQAFAFSRGDGGPLNASISNHSWNGATGNYTSFSLLYDEMVVDANVNLAGEQPMTVVVSSGNGGADSAGVRQFDSVAEPATAKNVITVGATENDRPSSEHNPAVANSEPPLVCQGWPPALVQDATDIRRLATFSATGRPFQAFNLGDPPLPIYAHNVRIKPDLVAPGARIFSTTPWMTPSTYTCSGLCTDYYPNSGGTPLTYHTYAQGTSFSAPAVAGGAALAHKWFLDRGTAPAPSLVKAAMIATADDLGDFPEYGGDHRPSHLFGWGRFNLDRLTEPAVSRFWVSEADNLAVGQQASYRVVVDDPSEDVAIVLAWSDPPSFVGGSQIPLINNLDLKVSDVGLPSTWHGNNFRENKGTGEDGYSHHFMLGGDPVLLDAINTVEAVFIPAGTFAAGQELDLRVLAAAVPQGTQSFSLYAYNARPLGPIGEVGQLTNLTHTPQTVTLARSYQDPVVFAQPPSFNGTNPAVARITDVTTTSFTIYIQEAPDHDGVHVAETVSYLVLEAGSWQLADGTRLDVGSLSTSATVGFQLTNQWAPVSFTSPFAALPVVLSQVQSENDPHWVKTRQGNLSTASFLLGLEEEEAKSTPHGQEKVGWLAMAPSNGAWSGLAYQAAASANLVTDAWYSQGFATTLTKPHLLASLASYQGGNNAQLRHQNLTSTGVELKIEEDTTFDPEMGHIAEIVHYLVFGGAGTLEASPR